jgi:hypothetical protein
MLENFDTIFKWFTPQFSYMEVDIWSGLNDFHSELAHRCLTAFP